MCELTSYQIEARKRFPNQYITGSGRFAVIHCSGVALTDDRAQADVWQNYGCLPVHKCRGHHGLIDLTVPAPTPVKQKISVRYPEIAKEARKDELFDSNSYSDFERKLGVDGL